MEKVKEVDKVEKKIIELQCIQDLIRSARRNLDIVSERINFINDMFDNGTASDYVNTELRNYRETLGCWLKLIETLENLI